LKSACPQRRSDFGRSEAMPVGQKHHERVAIAVAVLPDGLDQLVDLVGRGTISICAWSAGRSSAKCRPTKGDDYRADAR